jgi:hypothetical protein
MKALVLVAGLSMAACVSAPPSAFQTASTLATPESLSVNARWALTLLDGEGRIAGTIVMKLLETPIETCDGDGYRRVEILSQRLVDTSIRIHNPAYDVSGAALRVQLSTGLCDNGYAIVGGVADAGFEGIHMEEVLLSSAKPRSSSWRAYGVPLPD